MQFLRSVVALLALACAGVQAGTSGTNPLGQVIQLLDSLSAKITAAGEAEAEAYKDFAHWCEDTVRNTGFEVQTATTKKEKLEATISKLTADIETSGSKIEELAASVATGQADLNTAATIREKETADFAASEKELVSVIDTLGRAVAVLEREMAKNPAAFTQVDSSSVDGLLKSLSTIVDATGVSSADKQKLLALVQSQQGMAVDDDEPGAPAAATYKTHSTSILDVLEDLKEKAEEQLSGLRKAETNTKHNYDMLKQSLEDQAAADSKDLEEEKAAKAAAEEAKATAEGDLAGTVKDLADAQAALETTQDNCKQTAADHEATVAARTEELKVVAEAKQVLEATSGGAVGQTYSLLQTSQSTASGSRLRTRTDLANMEVVNMVKQLARKHHSAALAQLASRMAAVIRYGASAGEDPFVKVRGLISELITRLEAEAHDEATEKDYCDDQLAKTESKKAELEADLSKLTAKIDQAAAQSAGLKEEVRQLQANLATLAQQQAELDQVRKETHAAYAQAKVDLETGLQGVRQALGLLREYYGGAPAALLQGGVGALQQPTSPELHAKSTGAGSSIIGILEVVESDFAKTLATEEVQESDAQEEYEKVTQENKITTTLKDQDVTYKTQEFTSLDKSLSELTADRSTTDSELAAILEYYAKIKERCIAKPETYEQRAERRAAEIQGLKEALSVLENETALVQRQKRGLQARFLAAGRP